MNIRSIITVLWLVIISLAYSAILFAAQDGIFIKKIVLTGNTVLKQDQFAGLLKRYEGREITLSDLEELTSLIAGEYKKRGFTIAKAYIPEQKITGGVVTIAVLEGRISDIKIEGDGKWYSYNFIKSYLKPLMEQGVYNHEILERGILLLNDYPKLNVKARLQPGQEPGTTEITSKVESSLPFTLTLNYDNYGSKYLSTNRYSTAIEVANIFKEGALLSLRGLTGDDPNRLNFYRGGYSIPLNTKGTRFGIYYFRSDFDVGSELADLGITGRSEALGLFVTHPFIKKSFRSLTGELGFDFKDVDQFMLGIKTSSDKIRSVRAGLTYDETDVSGRSVVALSLTQGLGSNFGGKKVSGLDDPEASRTGADNVFTRINFDVVRIQRIIDPLFFFIKGSGQWSSDALVISEVYGIGGADSVRGYPYGEFVGDLGFTITAELRYAPLPDKKLLQVATFLDSGAIFVINSVEGQKNQQSLTGGGFGLRLSLPYQVEIKADAGFPIDPSSSSQGVGPIYYLQCAVKF